MNDDLEKVVNKGVNVYCEKSFEVFNGHENIYIGSNVFLVDSILNAGDTQKGKIQIEDYVFFGHGVKVLARGHDYNVFNQARQETITEKPIHIKQGAWIGSGSIVLGGVVVGQHSVVAAGSVVTKDVKDFTIVAGNPAKIIKYIKKESF